MMKSESISFVNIQVVGSNRRPIIRERKQQQQQQHHQHQHNQHHSRPHIRIQINTHTPTTTRRYKQLLRRNYVLVFMEYKANQATPPAQALLMLKELSFFFFANHRSSFLITTMFKHVSSILRSVKNNHQFKNSFQ